MPVNTVSVRHWNTTGDAPLAVAQTAVVACSARPPGTGATIGVATVDAAVVDTSQIG